MVSIREGQAASRALLMDRLARALERGRGTARTTAVLVLEIDRCKFLNDSHGRVVGDGVLRVVADRIRTVVRPTDTVARVGGDDFVVLVEVDYRSEVALLAARLLTAFDPVILLDGVDAFVTASLGIAIARPDSTAESLVRDADTALRHAKARGPGRVEFFDESIREQAGGVELRVLYQPIIAIASGELVSAEALVRRQHPDRVDELGVWVLHVALEQLATWGVQDSLLMAVNLSARQLRDSELAPSVADALARHGIEPSSVVLEIPEAALVVDDELVVPAIDTVHELKRIGVGLALDDFGSGYSSRRALERLPVDELKIDRELVQGLGSDARDSATVSATLTMANELHLSVVAEGVETFEQLERLRQLGCPLAQGFLFAEPLPAEQFAELLLARWDDPHHDAVDDVFVPTVRREVSRT